MNKIVKSDTVPDILLTRGSLLKQGLIAEADAGKTDFKFCNEVYADSSVKEKLKSDQHCKCAYCERDKSGDFGDVEHFRPKKAYRQDFHTSLNSPAYYWMAYDWRNLLFSCAECNRKFKGNLFPIADESKRGIRNRSVEQEEALLINPAAEDPGEFIFFEEHIVKARVSDGGGDIKGKTTIRILKLNERADLVEARRKRWIEYRTARETIAVLEVLLKRGIPEDIDLEDVLHSQQKILKEMTSESSEFTGMFKYQRK